jgi:hypothetical protein
LCLLTMPFQRHGARQSTAFKHDWVLNASSALMSLRAYMLGWKVVAVLARQSNAVSEVCSTESIALG